MIYLTVVLPVRNEEAHLLTTLEALADQDYPKERYELLVVDGRSTDGTRRVVERFIREHPDVNARLLDNPGLLSSRARNIGVCTAKGQLIAVIDAHVHIPNDQLFATMERLKERHQALCWARPAPLLVPGLDQGMPFWIALARKSWLAHSRDSYIYSDYEGLVDPVSSGFAYERSVFERVGYFDEAFDAAEDVEFHHRLKQVGIQAYTSPELTIYSYPRATLRGLFQQMTRYGVGRARLVRKHRDAFTKEVLIPPAVFLLFATFPLIMVLACWVPLLGYVYVGVLAAYWLILSATGFRIALARKQFLPGLFIAMAIWTTHMGVGWGFLKAAPLPRRLDSQLPQPALDR